MTPKQLPQWISAGKILLIGVFIQCFLMQSLWANADPDQNKTLEEIKLSIYLNEASLQQTIAEIENKTEFKFVFNEKILKKEYSISVQASYGSLGDVLRSISQQTALAFKQIGRAHV